MWCGYTFDFEKGSGEAYSVESFPNEFPADQNPDKAMLCDLTRGSTLGLVFHKDMFGKELNLEVSGETIVITFLLWIEVKQGFFWRAFNAPSHTNNFGYYLKQNPNLISLMKKMPCRSKFTHQQYQDWINAIVSYVKNDRNLPEFEIYMNT